MNDGELGDDEALRQALVGLQREIKARVELERERDPLTTLGNLRATQRAFDEAMSKGRFCFGAFLEVDYFKSINDQFGYEPANALLKRIGETLKEHSTAYFGITSAYRAHGDEFYLLGVCDSLNPSQIEQLEALLERSRSKIAEITVPGHAGLRCTVSVGWTTSESIDDEAVNFRVFSKRLEDAVAAAKARKRNCVVRYDPSMSKQPTFTLRMQCDACGAKLAFDVNHSNNRAAEDAYCCNCGHRQPRPSPPASTQSATSEAIELPAVDSGSRA